jgi:hypothetical protein
MPFSTVLVGFMARRIREAQRALLGAAASLLLDARLCLEKCAAVVHSKA